MNDYPASYVARPRPLLVLSGFDVKEQQEKTPLPFRNGPRIVCNSPLVIGHQALDLLAEFNKFDPDCISYESGNSAGDVRTVQWKIKPVGRSYELPCRKASPVPRSPGSPLTPPVLHSSLSPLSPSSPLYSDGIMHPLWNTKWQDLIPSVFISFFRFTSNSGNDDSLKSDITSLKTSLTEHYRIRFAAVLVGSELALLQDPSTDERLASIRKATKLDAKSSFFYVAPSLSSLDQANFVQAVMLALRPISQDFYRDLTKHSRRKKDRWGGPTPSPVLENQMTRAISKSGWVARYEYKMGVFAELRFEMDAASRHFFAALDALFDSDGVFERLSNWSPRWNEVRLFADAIAIRQIRCLLANGLPIATSRFWIKYRDTTKYLLDRRGKGTACYGWKAWEARWAKIMAELIQGSPSFVIDLIARKSLEGVTSNKKQVYVDADRDQSTDEPFEPWDMLHHGGYWFVHSANSTADRRTLAFNMPKEDRVPPGQSPATRVVHRHETYDTYLCPEPHMEYPATETGGFDHCAEIVSALQAAVTEFTQREQVRMADFLKLRIAKEYIEASKVYEALSVLKPLWQRHTWRKNGWPGLVNNVASTLYDAAEKASDLKTQTAAMWELMSFSPVSGVKFNLISLLNNGQRHEPEGTSTTMDVLKLGYQEISAFLDISFSFRHGEAHASEVMHAQIVITSRANHDSAPIVFSCLSIRLEGSIQQITIDHLEKKQHEISSSGHRSDVSSTELLQSQTHQNAAGELILIGVSDLTVQPDSPKIINVTMIPREAGSIRAITAQILLQANSLQIQYTKDLQTESAITYWWLGNTGKPRRRLALRNPGMVVVHPKLPKVTLTFRDIRDRYYTDEQIALDLEICNGEETEVDVTLEMRIPGHESQVLAIEEVDSDIYRSEKPFLKKISSLRLGAIPVRMIRRLRVTLQAPTTATKIAFEAKAIYEFESPLSNTSSVEIDVVNLFEPQYTINPDLHPATWPSFFSMDYTEELPTHSVENRAPTLPIVSTSITHRWKMIVTLTSMASENIIIKKVEAGVLSVSDGAHCVLVERLSKPIHATVTPNTQHAEIFQLDTQRIQLEDLRTTSVEAALKIQWCRVDAEKDITNTANIMTPRLLFPSSEPRVLVSRLSSSQDIIPINLMLENPSMHFLTFNVSIEPDEGFAFSGSKLATKHVAPMSRHCMRYNLTPFDRNTAIRPEFKVLDVHFNKSLHINPTGTIQSDARGIIIGWDNIA